MAHIKGWTLVLVWTTTALSIWLFHTIWPGLNAWLKANQHLSGWAQFFGAVMAIGGAYHLGKMQAIAARALVREQQLVETLRLMQSIRKLLQHTQHTLKIFREAWQLRGDLHQTMIECVRLRDMIEKIDITKCSSPALVEYLLQLPNLLNEAVEHQRMVNNNYTNAIVADRDQPAKRLQTFTREMNAIKAIENFIELAVEQALDEEAGINAMRQAL